MLSKFYDFLIRVDQDFPTSLSSKVDLMEYAKKLINFGFIVTAMKDNKIIGAVVIYCNDFDSLNSYIPLVAVDKDYRGQKISNALMICAINYVKGLGFHKIGIHTENPIALHLYKSLGFQIIENNTHRKNLELILK